MGITNSKEGLTDTVTTIASAIANVASVAPLVSGYYSLYPNLVVNNAITQPVLLLICKDPTAKTFLAHFDGSMNVGVLPYSNTFDSKAGATERAFLWAYYPATGLLSPFSDATLSVANSNNSCTTIAGTPTTFWDLDLANNLIKVRGSTDQVMENGGASSSGSSVITYTNDNNWTKKWSFYIIAGLTTNTGGSITDILNGKINMLMHSACPYKYDASNGGLIITNKCLVVIMDNASTGNALMYSRNSLTSTTASASVISAAPFDLTKLNQFILEYNPLDNSIRIPNSNNLCLINDGHAVQFEAFDTTTFKKRWILDLSTFAVRNLDTANCIENGGGASSGSKVAAYAFDKTPNKRWSFHIYNCIV